MSDERFHELLGVLLDGEPTTDEVAELVRLASDNPACLQEIGAQLEASEMIALAEDELRDGDLFAAALQSRIFEDPFVARARLQMKLGGRLIRPRVLVPWGVAAAAVFALVVFGLVPALMPADESVVELTEIEGPFQWTGDGGQVDTSLQSGRRLSGGTLESLAPDAWATLSFPDGTSATISGLSALTISAGEQKSWHLRQGDLTVGVTPQPPELPLLIDTPTAALQVLGTDFRVIAYGARTVLTVSEGSVRVERLIDGRVVEVGAGNRIVTTADAADEFLAVARGETTDTWRANLERDATAGEWVNYLGELRRRIGFAIADGEVTREQARVEFREFAERLEAPEALRATPRPTRARPGTDAPAESMYVTALTVSRGQAVPVVLTADSAFRIRGRVQQPREIVIGLGVGVLDGAGRARSVTPAINVRDEFEIVIPLSEFQARGLPLEGMELLSWFGFTYARDAQLEITGVELLGPAENETNR